MPDRYGDYLVPSDYLDNSASKLCCLKINLEHAVINEQLIYYDDLIQDNRIVCNCLFVLDNFTASNEEGAIMAEGLERFHQTFFEESGEHLAVMESGLLALESGADDECLNAIFRGAHSIKGSSGTFGFAEVARFTHSLENLLDRLRQRQMAITPPLVDLLLRSTDCLRSLVEAARSGGGVGAEVEVVRRELEGIVGGEATSKGTTSPSLDSNSKDRQIRVWDIQFTPGTDFFQFGSDPLLFLRDLTELGETEFHSVNDSRLPVLEELAPESCWLSWSVRLRSDAGESALKDVFLFAPDGSQLSIVPDDSAAVAQTVTLLCECLALVQKASEIQRGTRRLLATLVGELNTPGPAPRAFSSKL